MTPDMPQTAPRMTTQHRPDGAQSAKSTQTAAEPSGEDADFGLAWLGAEPALPEGPPPMPSDRPTRTAAPTWDSAATAAQLNTPPEIAPKAAPENAADPEILLQNSRQTLPTVDAVPVSKAPAPGITNQPAQPPLATPTSEAVPTTEVATAAKIPPAETPKVQPLEQAAAPNSQPPASNERIAAAPAEANPNAAQLPKFTPAQAAAPQERSVRNSHIAESPETLVQDTAPLTRQAAPSPTAPQMAAVQPQPAPPPQSELDAQDIAPDDIDFRQLDSAKSDQLRTEAQKLDAPRSETARQVSTQIVDAVRQGRDGTIEVSLSPEELGKVKLTLSGNDGQMHVLVQSDRPETQDLLRRHISQLQQDFRDLGYADISFDFKDSPRRDGQFAEQNTEPTGTYADAKSETEAMNPATQSTSRSRMPASAGLDLRL